MKTVPKESLFSNFHISGHNNDFIQTLSILNSENFKFMYQISVLQQTTNQALKRLDFRTLGSG